MPPANYGCVHTRPSRSLVGHVADNSGRAVLRDRQFLHLRQNAIGQHNLAAHIRPRVIALASAISHVHQLGLNVGAMAVVRQPDGIGLPVSDQSMLRTHLPQPAFLHGPSQVRAHQAISLVAVDRKLLGMSVVQAVFACALQHELRGLVKVSSGRNAMQAGEVAKILIRRGAVRFISEQRPLMSIQERFLP